jgi:capsular polysaccharide biosynthesis protein
LNTETSTEPEGITRRVMLNVLEAFFRRPWLHLLPLILMLALGAATVASMKPQFLSVGILRATNESLLNDITAANSNQGFAFESPATLHSNTINELLRTDEFIDQVAQAAEVSTAEAQLGVLRSAIRSSIGAFPDGDNLVRVTAKTDFPEDSERLAEATIDAYRAAAVQSQTDQSPSTEEFLTLRVQEAEQRLNEANQALDAFIDQNPQLSTETARIADQTALNRLQGATDRAQTQYNAALDALDAAQLATAQAETVVNQRIQEIDDPGPGIKESVVRKQGMTLILFGVLGVMLSLALVIVTATLDRTIRIPNDITARFGLDVLAVVPDTKR